MRVPKDVWGRDIADAGREPYPMVLEQVPLVDREAVEPVRDSVEAYELPRVCALGAPTTERVTGADLFASGALAVFGRVAV